MENDLVSIIFIVALITIPILVFLVKFIFLYIIIKLTPFKKRTGVSPALAALLGAIGMGYFNK